MLGYSNGVSTLNRTGDLGFGFDPTMITGLAGRGAFGNAGTTGLGGGVTPPAGPTLGSSSDWASGSTAPGSPFFAGVNGFNGGFGVGGFGGLNGGAFPSLFPTAAQTQASIPGSLQPFAQGSFIAPTPDSFAGQFAAPGSLQGAQLPTTAMGLHPAAQPWPTVSGAFGAAPALGRASWAGGAMSLPGFAPTIQSGRTPLMNIWDDGGRLRLEVEAPGVSLDDIELQISGRTLFIRTGRVIERSAEREHLVYCERPLGPFMRAVQLPAEIDLDGVEAKLVNGVLELTLTKVGAEQRKTIRVSKVGQGASA